MFRSLDPISGDGNMFHLKEHKKKLQKKLVSENHGGGGAGGGPRYMLDYYIYAKYHHVLWSAILDFGLGIIILV